MTLRAEEAERHIKQFAEKLESLEQRGLPSERNHLGGKLKRLTIY